MIDVHCHIVPGVDDGSEDPAESLAMGEAAAESGVTDIIVTPHCNIPGEVAGYAGPKYEEAFLGLRRLFRENGVEIRLHRGMEVFGTDDVGELLDRGLLMTMAGSRYLLIEFPFDDDMWRARDVLFAVWRRGVVPIIAHPERYYAVQDDPQFALDWVKMGCLLQINRTSLLAPRSPEYAAALRLLDARAVHFAATDAHGVFVRTTELVDAYRFIKARYGEAAARLLTEDNPRRILENKRIMPME